MAAAAVVYSSIITWTGLCWNRPYRKAVRHIYNKTRPHRLPVTLHEWNTHHPHVATIYYSQANLCHQLRQLQRYSTSRSPPCLNRFSRSPPPLTRTFYVRWSPHSTLTRPRFTVAKSQPMSSTPPSRPPPCLNRFSYSPTAFTLILKHNLLCSFRVYQQ